MHKVGRFSQACTCQAVISIAAFMVYRAKTRSPIQAFPRLASSLLISLGTIHGRFGRRLRRMVCACNTHEPRREPQEKAALGRCQRAHIPDQEPSAHRSRSMNTRAASSVPTAHSTGAHRTSRQQVGPLFCDPRLAYLGPVDGGSLSHPCSL
jgi:hypothetical protein